MATIFKFGTDWHPFDWDGDVEVPGHLERLRRARRGDSRRRTIGIALLLCAGLAVIGAISAVLLRTVPAGSGRAQPVATVIQHGRAGPGDGVDALQAPPLVEPLELKALAPADARAINAAVPFSTYPNPSARPFVVTGDVSDMVRATDCLAAAVLFEAGDDLPGQRAVAQVVLNRLRHPAFVRSVCSVVFQGSDRSTGCQFTFTCDGAMARRPDPAAWARARAVAARAMAGSVFAPVGMATHYHTDRVVPYWSGSLEKVAAVKTHLFFRWAGAWGHPAAFTARYGGVEPVIPAMAALSESHRNTERADAEAAGAAAAASALAASVATAAAAPASYEPTASNPDAFLVTFGADIAPSTYPDLARQACGVRRRCVLMAWSSPTLTPKALPASTAQLEAMSFHYLRDPALAQERMRWDCTRAPGVEGASCLSRQANDSQPSGFARP